ncbi:helix-turn-helix domain-containing protein [Taibaiella koreensis]|uniref:helix-turn-helix domain-containing protein n=1 Tax=Taibaiella koreensis TaxID=1268548 RepID=UPI000E59E59F|nr:helix-turn-helix domain-containing protein [Taibaiella koreensis]
MNIATIHSRLKEDPRVHMPATANDDVSRFNVLHIRHNSEAQFNCKPYNRKGLFKISLLKGHTRLFYADKTIEFSCGLLFSNPNIPYSWEHIEAEQSAYFCAFTESFFDHFVPIREYPLYQPGQTPFFPLDEAQYEVFRNIFEQMLEEIALDFSYKYDALRTMVLQLIYAALKLEPAAAQKQGHSNGIARVASLFLELLERQFPIELPAQRMTLRYPSDFSTHLAVHVNHLNHVLKTVTGKTTSQLIALRLMQEARSLLHHTDWNISEIAWCLGFEELPHFIHFFKKHEGATPRVFRRTAMA